MFSFFKGQGANLGVICNQIVHLSLVCRKNMLIQEVENNFNNVLV